MVDGYTKTILTVIALALLVALANRPFAKTRASLWLATGALGGLVFMRWRVVVEQLRDLAQYLFFLPLAALGVTFFGGRLIVIVALIGGFVALVLERLRSRRKL